MVVLRRTKRAMVRAMCDEKLMKKRTEDLMEMLELKETMVWMAKANGVKWYGHVLRRDDGLVLRKVLEFEVKGKRTAKEDVEDASGEGEQECWFGEGGCNESCEMERLLLEWGKSGNPRLRG